MDIFSTSNIAFGILGYSLSYVELLGTIFGLISVYLAAKSNILTWPTGILNEVFLFALFFQVQLYADMVLQLYFFVLTLYGWKTWKSNKGSIEISILTRREKYIYLLLTLTMSVIIGIIISNIHVWLPALFRIEAAYPYLDSFIMSASICATMLLARKNIETWYWWIAIDVVCVGLYSFKGLYFLAFEYLIFLCLAIYGCYNWRIQLKNG
jgi:nicotinamide mononucleotide transporter